MKRITVLGIGNILLQDEGFGVRVIEELQRRYRFTEPVQVLDGGTLGMELLHFITGSARLLVIDAIDGGQPPGSFYRLTGEAVQAYFQDKVSLHELGLKDVLAALKVLDEPVEEVVIIGVQPAVLDLGLDLTPAVVAMIEPAIAAVIAQLKGWQAEVWENG
ncbi:HyaD/HybD family hydrogenase maturation endopeptidase [Acetonema longum]|uniref:HupD hydrogenase related function n=1 Tax=Acetonema longum DSM 6540 TaxID=1009370 RepID=F7NIS6_9FIRM|nr:HyaD/HybD family hydrogenase maturation endopeptidase [Acetonema longum]EGO64049.1 HupD hydrogenase related function [Acetonema longum DSM 6540]